MKAVEPARFQEYAEQIKDELLDKTMGLLKIPSVYDPSTAKEYAPFGTGIKDALEYLLHMGEQEGFKVKNMNGYAGHIEWGEGDELLGILGHVDVVPPGDGWSQDPFSPYVKNEKLYARGVQDDKGPVMAAFFAMKMLKDLGVKPHKRIRLILGTDEERSWKCMDHYFTCEDMPDFGFSPDAEFPVIHAEKGLLDLEIFIPAAENDHKSDGATLLQFSGGDRLNMVPARAEAVLAVSDLETVQQSYREFLDKKQIQGQIEKLDDQTVKMICFGKTAHGSTPDEGVNAVMLLLEFLAEIPGSEVPNKQMKKMVDYFKETNGKGLRIHVSDDVSGPLTLNAGTAHMDHSGLTIGVNIRYPVTVPEEQWYPALEEILKQEGWKAKKIDHMKPLYIPEDDPFVLTLLDAYKRQTGEEGSPISIGGATYARVLSKGVAYGAMFPQSTDTAHQADEHMEIKDLVRATAIYADAIYHLTIQNS